MGLDDHDNAAMKRKDFLWREDKNLWHVHRAREMRKKYSKEITKLEGSDPYALIPITLMTSSHWLIAALMSAYFEDQY